MAEIRNPKRPESQAETQKLRNGERELETQELRRLFQNLVAADVSPRQFQMFAPTDVGGYGVLQEPLRKGLSDRKCFAGSLSGFPDFLIRHCPAGASKLGKSLSEFLSFGFAAFTFLLSAFGLRICAASP